MSAFTFPEQTLSSETASLLTLPPLSFIVCKYLRLILNMMILDLLLLNISQKLRGNIWVNSLLVCEASR